MVGTVILIYLAAIVSLIFFPFVFSHIYCAPFCMEHSLKITDKNTFRSKHSPVLKDLAVYPQEDKKTIFYYYYNFGCAVQHEEILVPLKQRLNLCPCMDNGSMVSYPLDCQETLMGNWRSNDNVYVKKHHTEGITENHCPIARDLLPSRWSETAPVEVTLKFDEE